MVEAAIVLPLFLFVLFGAIEISAYLLDVNSVRNAAREAGREASASAAGATADYNAILSARRGLTGMANTIDGLIIYKAAGANDPVPASCIHQLDTTGSGVSGLCNVYTATQVATADITNFGFDSATNPDPLLWDANWPSTERREALSATQESDFVGLYVRVQHSSLTGLLTARTITGTAVFQIEPRRAE